MNKYYYSDDGLECILTNPRTPRPWHSYLVNERYLVNLTQLGTGASHYQPLGEGLRCNVTEDRDGSGGPRFVYLRDCDSARSWSLTGAPHLPTMNVWETHFGPGWWSCTTQHQDIEATWRVMVPPGEDPCEVWTITVVNRSSRLRRLAVFPYLEMHLTGGSTLMDFIAVLGGFYSPEDRAVFGINNCLKFPNYFKSVLAVDHPVAGATVSKDEFVGHYRDYRNPLAVERGDVHNPQAGTEWLGASLRVEVELAAGESRTINAMVACISSVEEGQQLIKTHLTAGAPEQAFQAIRTKFLALRDRNRVSTGEVQADRWANILLKRQLAVLGDWGRVIGRGYRDMLQDCFAHRLLNSELAKRRLLESASKQYTSGECIRAWRLPNAELDLQKYADSPSWLPMAASMYVQETGDFTVLDTVVPFLDDKNPYGPSQVSAPLWQHLTKAMEWLLENRGHFGLCRIYHGDWCDTMNGVGSRGEGVSVMLSMQTKWSCDLMAGLARRRGETAFANHMEKAAQELTTAINTHAWDGEWYIRAFDDDGIAVGSSNPPASDKGELRLFINPQSWSLLSGVATHERALKAIAAVERHCETGYGKTLHWPVSTFLKPRIGQMSAMTPGFYENGSVYTHGNCFWIAALALSGRADEAWAALRTVLPDTDNKPQGDAEPFAIPNMYIGPAVPRRAQKNLYLSPWRTGSASWLYYIFVELLCGARADFDGLRIRPNLPKVFAGGSIDRHFRGAIYRIQYQGHGSVVRSITVDGKVISGDLLPIAKAGSTVAVQVVLG